MSLLTVHNAGKISNAAVNPRLLPACLPMLPPLCIPPTNHVVDFMMGFLLPFTSGATVVHLRTLRPEFVRDAFTRYKIAYMMLVPLILKNLKKGMEANFAALPKGKRTILNA